MITHTIDRYLLAVYSAILSGCIGFWMGAFYGISHSGLAFVIETNPTAATVFGLCAIVLALFGATAFARSGM